MERKMADYRYNGMINVPDIMIEYQGYIIQPKLDMGRTSWFSNGNQINRGYVITDGTCNIMPGGTWAHSVLEAKVMIDIYIESAGISEEFWNLLREKQGLAEWEYV